MSASSESGRQSLWRREGILRSSPLASNCMSCPAEDVRMGEEGHGRMRAACAAINAKLGDTQAELHEHKMVITALEPLPDDRRCFRLLGSVLVEKTKAEVLPQMVEQKTKVRATAELSREGRGRTRSIVVNTRGCLAPPGSTLH